MSDSWFQEQNSVHSAKISMIVDIAMDRNNYDGEVLAAVVHARMRRVGLSPLQPHLFDRHDLTIVLCAPRGWASICFGSCMSDAPASASVIVSGQHEATVSG
jgi:hypothetical protein